jgi:hypothetical protein
MYPAAAGTRLRIKRQTSCNVPCSSSSLLLPLLAPTLAATPSVTALSPVVVVVAILLTVTSENVSAAHGKRCGCEAVGEIDLRADSVGKV